MAATKTQLRISACAAAVGCAFSVCASAQSVETMGRNLLNNASAVRSMESVTAGADRAIKTPLEVVWLQAEVQDDMWRSPALASALQNCGKLGTPKEGCAVSVRSAWRYSFDANSGVRPSAIFISALSIPQAPFGAGRLNLTGTGRVYIVTPHASGSAAIRPPSGAILLAAGSTVQLIDAAHPMIQIEVKAPEDQPLFLGNLAESDLTKVVALLVKQPGVLSASAASLLETGQVALRAPAPALPSTQVAAVSPARVQAPKDAVAALDQDFSLLAGVVEAAAESRVAPEQIVMVSIDLNAMAGRLELPSREPAKPEPLREQDFAMVAGAIELSSPLPAVVPEPLHARDFVLLASAVEKSSALPLPAPFDVATADLSIIAGKLDLPVRESARVPVAPIQVAMLSVAPVLASIPAGGSDLARMRAEVEAEIARERERMAQPLQLRLSRQFRFGT